MAPTRGMDLQRLVRSRFLVCPERRMVPVSLARDHEWTGQTSYTDTVAQNLVPSAQDLEAQQDASLSVGSSYRPGAGCQYRPSLIYFLVYLKHYLLLNGTRSLITINLPKCTHQLSFPDAYSK